jgi:acetyl esterase/lipase
MPKFEDVTFATVNGHDLLLDIYTPDDVENPPLVMWIHGGGWRGGSYKGLRVPWLVDYGYAVASISYHLTDRAIFPQQIYDCKGALRWLRAHANKYGFDRERVAVAGASAGAHLAMLLGVTPHCLELEGEVGGNLDQCSSVKAIMNYFGPSDFILRVDSDPNTATSPERGSFLLLGGAKTGHIDMDLARQASPAIMMNKNAPPIISFHGDADTTVLLDQAERIGDAYREHGCYEELHRLSDGTHGDKRLFEGVYQEKVISFLNNYL